MASYGHIPPIVNVPVPFINQPQIRTQHYSNDAKTVGNNTPRPIIQIENANMVHAPSHYNTNEQEISYDKNSPLTSTQLRNNSEIHHLQQIDPEMRPQYGDQHNAQHAQLLTKQEYDRNQICSNMNDRTRGPSTNTTTLPVSTNDSSEINKVNYPTNDVKI